MLTGYQCETVAFTFHGAIICPDCAVAATSTITVAKAERGLSHGFSDLSPLIRYSLDEYIGENASEYADNEVGNYSDNPDAWQDAYDAYPEFIECGGCGAEIS